MNDLIPMRRALAAALAIAALAPLACSKPAMPPPLAGAAVGGAFDLVDQDGHRATDRQFAGRYRLVYFGYTYCPDVCPDTLQKLMKGVAAFRAAHPAEGARLASIFVSVDPDRDTPAVMKQYVAAFGNGLIGLTGRPEEIATVAKRYGVYYRKAPQAAGAAGYLVDHSSAPILFGPDGAPIVLLPVDRGADAVAAELGTWVR